MRDRPRRAGRRILLACGLLLVAAAFFVGTPFVLLAASRIGDEDWLVLGNVGQAYGGIAAMLGILALIGVIESLRIQHRDSAANLELVQRTIHGNLLAQSVEDPELLACWGPLIYDNETEDRQYVYINQIVSFWRSMFEIEMIAEAELEALAEHMFSNAPGRRYWSTAGKLRRANYASTRDMRFFEIMEQAHRKAGFRPTSEESRIRQTGRSGQPQTARKNIYGTLMVGLVAGVAISETASAISRRWSQ